MRTIIITSIALFSFMVRAYAYDMDCTVKAKMQEVTEYKQFSIGELPLAIKFMVENKSELYKNSDYQGNLIGYVVPYKSMVAVTTLTDAECS